MSSPHDSASPPEDAVENDSEAFSWGDDERDATYVDAAAPIPQRAVKAPREGGPAGSNALVGFGVLGGIYLLYTVAWLVSASLLQIDTTSVVTTVFSDVLRVVAIMAPALWYVASLWLGQGLRVRTRFVWLVIGAIVLVPWPFILTRSFG